MNRSRYFIVALLSLVILFPEGLDAQCAMCRAVLESDASGDVPMVSRGVNNGILYLMGFPYLLMLGVAVFVFRDKIRSVLGRK